MTWAVVPLKAPENAKSRLAPLLCNAERYSLFYSMARHVIATLSDSPGVARIYVVTASVEVAKFSRRLGVHVIEQDTDHGTAAAFTAALDYLRSTRIERLLMISGDLPLLNPAAVHELTAAKWVSPSIVLAPDRGRTGTNALLCTPPDAIPPLFGENSFDEHRHFARQFGIACRIVDRLELALDLDVPADIEYLIKCGLAPSARGGDAVRLRNLRTSGGRLDSQSGEVSCPN